MRVLCFFSLIAFSNLGYGQNADEYIVLLNGDTLRGKIKAISINKRINVIEFTKEGATESERYKPEQVKGFYDIEFGLHECYLIDADNFSVSNEKEIEPTSVQFLEVLTKGEISLFSFKEGEVFFIRSQDHDLERLEYKVRKVLVNENGKIVNSYSTGTHEKLMKDEIYKRQLASYMTKQCAGIYKDISKVSLTSKSLVTLFQKFYECSGDKRGELVTQSPDKRGRMVYGVLTGMSFSQPVIVSPGKKIYSIQDAEFDRSRNFLGGAYLDYFISKRNQKLSALFELYFGGVQSNTPKYRFYTTSGSQFEYNFDVSYLRVNTTAKYALGSSRFKFEFLAGVGNSIAVSKELKGIVTLDSNGEVRETDFSGELQSWQILFLGGVGVRYDRVALSGRYEFASGFIKQNNYYHSKMNSAVLTLSYRLSKTKS